MGGGQDRLNSIGIAILEFIDYRTVAVITVLIYILLSLIILYRFKKWPNLNESLSAVISIVSLFTGVAVFCVFVLTKPPAIGKLSEDTQGAIGLICPIVLIILGCGELRSFFVKKKPPANNPAQTPPAA